MVATIRNPGKKIAIAIVGKYFDSGDFSLADSYLSVYQALIHAGAQLDSGITITWLDAKMFEADPDKLRILDTFAGVIVPGGFGASGVEGKIKVIEYVRTHAIPYLGLCYGMQLAAVEFARNVCCLKAAHTTEVDAATPYPIIDLLPLQKQTLADNNYGGTMRLGTYGAAVKDNSCIQRLYKGAGRLQQGDIIHERHRHRYEVNPAFVTQLEQAGLHFSGSYTRADGTELMRVS